MEPLEGHWLDFAVILIQCGAFKLAYNYMRKFVEKQDARDDAVRSLLRTEIINICHMSLESGYIPIYNLENVMDMYRSYKALDGNGAIDAIYKQTIVLPHSIAEKKP
ncbi:hypothetical protein [uncultured Megasphaera sp.]|uniref:hypothetical protein n=1 Tax=uncultured Megasphaera sp. TaxID=165188 RepID=UPI0026596B60|nr:hypothetical protein [uncultured Megasphaera sp.]